MQQSAGTERFISASFENNEKRKIIFYNKFFQAKLDWTL